MSLVQKITDIEAEIARTQARVQRRPRRRAGACAPARRR